MRVDLESCRLLQATNELFSQELFLWIKNQIFVSFLQNDNTYRSSSASDKDSDDESIKSHESAKYDTTAATYLDIAVLRCLFILHWQEEGVYWCLHYMYNRYDNSKLFYEYPMFIIFFI